jgi:Zn-dependent protease with chaperone function
LRSIHTSSRRQSIEVVAALGMGFYTNSHWIALHSAVKTATITVPLVATAVLAIHKIRKTEFDPLLNRKKYLMTRKLNTQVPNVTFLTGPGVEMANGLLHELIELNRMRIPYLSHDSHNWQVLFFKDPNMWIDCFENGVLICSKEIMSTLSRNEIIALLSTQVAHVLAKHKTESMSFRMMMHQSAAITAWYYGFFVPIQHSYPVDMGIAFILYQIISYLNFQRKFRSLCLEADRLGLLMASSMGVTEQDAISLMRKMITLRNELPVMRRIRAMCHYQYRISALEQRIAATATSHVPK